MKSINRILSLWAVFPWILVPALAFAGPTAIVTDLTGHAILKGQPDRPLNILADVDSGAVVKADTGSRVVIVYLNSGEEYEINGPSEQLIGNDKPETKSGAAAIRRGPALRKQLGDSQIRTAGLAQAAVVMRGLPSRNRIKFITLSSTQTLDPRPEFRWAPVPGVEQYHFELIDGAGRIVLSKDVGETAIELPVGTELVEDGSYTWTVSGISAEGRQISGAANFNTASAETRRQVEALRPGDHATVSEQVTYAIWLEQLRLKDEARKYWKAALEKRGDEPRLSQLATE